MEDLIYVLKLEKLRRRFEPGEQPSWRYRFAEVKRYRIPQDADSQVPVRSNGESQPAGGLRPIDPTDSG
jgi:hypothetical protein